MYDVRFYKGNYRWRQKQANRDECVCYVEQHFNSCVSPDTDYTMTIVGYRSSKTSKKWGRWYSKKVSEKFNAPIGGTRGIVVGGYGGRGNGNLKHTRMPAVLLEPLWCSNPTHAKLIRSNKGQNKLAKILVASIKKFFPKGGRVGFSVGHKYKTKNSWDRGANVLGGGTEADYAEIVLKKAKVLLEK